MATHVSELARGASAVVLRKCGMSRDEFVRDHLEPSVPVVIGDATREWSARDTFTPAWFCARFGDRRVDVDGKEHSVRALFDALAESSVEHPAPYPCHWDMLKVFPELADQIEPRPAYANPDRTQHPLQPQRFLGAAHTVELFFGGPGGQFPYLHYDYMGLHAFISQLYGRKEFTVVAPEFTDCVYPEPDNPWRSSIENHHAPDPEQYPLFAQAEKLTFVVNPGDTLFIPNGWWHTARSLEVTISVAFDLLNDSNWGRFRSEVHHLLKQAGPAKQLAADLYLRALGRLLSFEERIHHAARTPVPVDTAAVGDWLRNVRSAASELRGKSQAGMGVAAAP